MLSATIPEAKFLEVVDDAGYTPLAIEVSSALRAGRLEGERQRRFGEVQHF